MTDAEKIATLRAALKPFVAAALARSWITNLSEKSGLDDVNIGGSALTNGDLREAARVYRVTDSESIQSVTIHYPGHEVTQTVADGKVVSETWSPVPGYSPTPAFNEDGSMVHPPSPQGEFYAPAPFSPAEEEQKQRLREKEINK